jgi:hypothetical protein
MGSDVERQHAQQPDTEQDGRAVQEYCQQPFSHAGHNFLHRSELPLKRPQACYPTPTPIPPSTPPPNPYIKISNPEEVGSRWGVEGTPVRA